MAATVSRHPNQGQDSVLWYDPLFQGSGPFSHSSFVPQQGFNTREDSIRIHRTRSFEAD